MSVITNHSDHIKIHVKEITKPQPNPANIASFVVLVSNWMNRHKIQKMKVQPCVRNAACIKPKCAGFASSATGTLGSFMCTWRSPPSIISSDAWKFFGQLYMYMWVILIEYRWGAATYVGYNEPHNVQVCGIGYVGPGHYDMVSPFNNTCPLDPCVSVRCDSPNRSTNHDTD